MRTKSVIVIPYLILFWCIVVVYPIVVLHSPGTPRKDRGVQDPLVPFTETWDSHPSRVSLYYENVVHNDVFTPLYTCTRRDTSTGDDRTEGSQYLFYLLV